MKIVLGSEMPNQVNKGLLEKLGFDLTKIEKNGKYFELEVPSNAQLRCKTEQEDFDRQRVTVSYNNIAVITIIQKLAIYDPWVELNMNESAIDKALALPPVQPVQKVAPKPMSAFQEQVMKSLVQVKHIVLDGGASRGYAGFLPVHLDKLRKLKVENPTEHDELINSKAVYKKLLTMFPNWNDDNNLEKTLAATDAGGLFFGYESMMSSAPSPGGQSSKNHNK